MSKERSGTPRAIMNQIKRQAEEDWADDPDMLQYTIDTEVDAYQELRTMETDNIPGSALAELRQAAEREHPNDYSGRLEYVKNGIRHYLYVRRLNETIEPVKELLIKMESIIGSECYNANTQNYGPGGVWEGEGRSYRYPITFLVNERDDKRSTTPSDIDPEVLMTGRYRFGANELNIFRALEKIVQMLQDEYGLRLTRRTS